ncbi:hypothetical protein [Streptomyces sp. CAU 1734]|uniref:hypothetical protein n=1 Tax=Streptomyces sp. CAU 1734 TaxID=3140360 RepID=UPI00325FEA73
MDELTRVRELRDHAPHTDRAVLAAGRRGLTDAIAAGGRRRSPRWSGGALRRLRSDWRTAALGAATAVTAAAVLIAQFGAAAPVRDRADAAIGGTSGRAVEVLERAAVTVGRETAVPEPAAGQWIYTSHESGDRARPQTAAGGATAHSVFPVSAPEQWTPYAGTQDGKDGTRSAQDIYRAALALPADDPEAFLAGARLLHPAGGRSDAGRSAAGRTPAERDFRVLGQLIESYPLAPASRAGLYRALATVPGIRAGDEPIRDGAGRMAISIGLATDRGTTWSEILLDPADYSYAGKRMVALQDYAVTLPEAEKAPKAERAEKVHRYRKGDVLYNEARTGAAVVAAMGRRA